MVLRPYVNYPKFKDQFAAMDFEAEPLPILSLFPMPARLALADWEMSLTDIAGKTSTVRWQTSGCRSSASRLPSSAKYSTGRRRHWLPEYAFRPCSMPLASTSPPPVISPSTQRTACTSKACPRASLTTRGCCWSTRSTARSCRTNSVGRSGFGCRFCRDTRA